jgi:hypothetical protein
MLTAGALVGGSLEDPQEGEVRDRAGIFGGNSGFRATETRLSRVSRAKAREVKDYSGGTAKPDLRRTAWWAR